MGVIYSYLFEKKEEEFDYTYSTNDVEFKYNLYYDDKSLP